MSDYKYKPGDKVWHAHGGELHKRVVTHVCTNGDYIFAQSLHALRRLGARPDELWPRGKKTIARLIAEAVPDEPQWSVDSLLAEIEQLKRERDSALNRIARIRGFCGG